jgi:hypothetical protein
MRLGTGVAGDKRRLVELIRSHPEDRTAVEDAERTITYGELGRLIDERAGALRAAGGGAGAFVAIDRRKSAAFVVDYLSVLALGGTVVPIDPDTPAERRRTFLELARPELLARGSEIVRLAGDPDRSAPDDGAFVYFTSGSTGVPKPVLGSAAALRSFLDWFVPDFGIDGDDRFAFRAGVSFEASLRDIFPRRGGNLTGRCLAFAEREEIALPRAGGETMRAIARGLGRSPSTISRELRRNADRDGGYRPTAATRWSRSAWRRQDQKTRACLLQTQRFSSGHVRQL